MERGAVREQASWTLSARTAARRCWRGRRRSRHGVASSRRADREPSCGSRRRSVVGVRARPLGPRRAARDCSSSPATTPPRARSAERSQALATQVSLALESAALTEEVHRRTSEARFGSLVQHSSDLITVLDSSATVVYQSPSIERVLGYSPDDVVGTPFARLVDPAEHGRLYAPARGRRGVRGQRGAGPGVLAAPPGRQRAPVRDPAHEPARRRARPRHRPQRPRRQRAQGVRGAARPPGVPRSGDEPRQPRALRRARAPRGRSCAPRALRARGDLRRPRRLQDDQRQPRPRGGRRGAAGGREAADREHPRQRHRGPLRRRRVRHPPRGRRGSADRSRHGRADP